MTELGEQVEQLSRRLDCLEAENAQLREQLGDASTAGTESAPRSMGRRNLLRLGGAAAAIGAGSVFLRPGVAGASTAAMSYGTDNDAGVDGTGLTSSNATDTLHVTNSSTAGEALHADTSDASSTAFTIHGVSDSTDSNAAGVVGEITDPTSTATGVFGAATSGFGVFGATGGNAPAAFFWCGVFDNTVNAPAVEVEHDGAGHGVYSHIEKATSVAAAVRAKTIGKGAGIDASSSLGVGGKFAGKTAQVRLTPSTASSHPSTGTAGDLFVDKSKRLWYCKGGTAWKQLA